MDLCRIREGEYPTTSILTVIIGVQPRTLADEDASRAAFRCLDILKEFGVTDVDVEVSEGY